MDDEAAMLARRVAVDASAWLRHPEDPQVYARLVNAIAVWDAYVEPRLESGEMTAELLDELTDEHDLPQPLGDLMPGLAETLRSEARRQL